MSETNKMDKLILNGQNIDLSPDYQNVRNKPTINGVPVDGNKTLDDFGVATKQEVANISEKVDKLPYGIFYGQYNDVESLPDVSQLTQKGYAYVASSDLNIFYIYTYDGESDAWQDSENKFDSGSLESNLSTKSKIKAPTTKAVKEGIEAIDVTLSRSAEDENELTKAQKYNASANINDRAADVAPVTNEVKALGYKVLNPQQDFATQLTDANTIYEIRDEFDLNNSSVVMPANCTFKFNGGKIAGVGTLTLTDTTLEGTISFGRELTLSGKASNDVIRVEWFGAVGDGVVDDSNALKNAIAVLKQKNSTLVFGDGKTYLHGDGEKDLTNDPDMTLHTGYSYPRASQDDSTADYLHPSGPSAIGRDIMLRFLGYDGLTIKGNGSTIVSNPNNGICMHNSILFFGACSNSIVRNLTINGNRTKRVVNVGVQFNDWSTGSYPTYPNGIIPSWLEQVWLESAASDASQKGYNLVSNIHVAACHDMVFEDIVSTDAMMDDLMVNKATNDTGGFSYNITVIASTLSYAARSGYDVGQCKNAVVANCKFINNGYYTNGTLDTVGSGNHGGFTTELESEPVGFEPITCKVEGSYFSGNDEAGVKLGTGTINSVVDGCEFHLDRAYFPNGNFTDWKTPSDNSLLNSTFYNCQLFVRQSGCIIRGNKFYFDKEFKNNYAYDDDSEGGLIPYLINSSLSTITLVNPFVFEGNLVNVDVDGLTKTVDGKIYYDATKTKGQGRFRVDGDNKKIIIRDNTFKNVMPTVIDRNGYVGRSGTYFRIVEVKGIIENNYFINDYPNIYWLDGSTERTDGKVRLDLRKNYSNYTEKDIVDSNNELIGGTSATVNIADKGTTAERPDLLSILGADVAKVDFFKYENTSRGTNEVFFTKHINQQTIKTIQSSGAKNQWLLNTYTADELKYFIIIQFPNTILPKMYFVKNTNAPEFELERYYTKPGANYALLTSKPNDWEYAFYTKYYELIDGEYVLISGTAIEDVLTDAIEVPFTYTNLTDTRNNKAEVFFQMPDASVYPYILCQKNGDYSTATIYQIADAVSYWTAEDGYAAIERKGSVRPTGMHKDNGNIVGELLPNDVGLCFYDTNIKKPIYVDSVNNTTGVVVWVDANGEPVGLQVSDTTVLLDSAANSTKEVSVYYPSGATVTVNVQNPDGTTNTDFTAVLSTNTLTITATAANSTSAPIGVKVIVSDGTDVKIINVVQSY